MQIDLTKSEQQELQMFKPEVVTFGETMALFMPIVNKDIEHASHMEKLFGGAESNVAIGISRLGHRAGWFGRLGADPLGRTILKRIRGEGVDVSRAALLKEGPSGLMLRETVSGRTSVYYYRTNSAASLMRPDHLDESYIAQARILHVTGITPALSDNCAQTVQEAIRMARRNGVKVSFDPNLRLKLWRLEAARSTLLSLAAEVDYFLPGLEELKLLYHTDDEEKIFAMLAELSAVCIVKAGSEAIICEPGRSRRSIAYFKVDTIIDTVGAGDAFAAGFLAGLLKDYTLDEAARLGNLLGSLCIQFEGDWEGLPTWEQVEALLSDKAHIER